MVSKARNQARELARRGPRREPKHRILIVCEGEKTEPIYFKDLQHRFRNRLVHVEINDESGVPMTLVERAIALRAEAQHQARAQRDDNLLYDEVWCVCDVDEHPRLDEACELAKAQGIDVAVSNPCFELWAILHFRDQSASLHRKQAQQQARDLTSAREAKLIPFDKLHVGYAEAVRRATELQRIAGSTGELRRNPSTNVYQLTERIRSGGGQGSRRAPQK